MSKLPSPFLLDGGTGTYLQELFPKTEGAFEEYNIHHPQVVVKLHREYIKAGAMGIKTNTFGANTVALSMEFSQVREIVEKGIDLAKEAIGEGTQIVFGSIGPINTLPEKAMDEYKRLIDCFLEKEVTHFLFETFPSGEFFEELSTYIKEKCVESFILVSFAAYPSGETRLGLLAKELLLEMDELPGIDGIGLNCISGPHHLIELAKTFPPFHKRFSLMPNASYPTIVAGKAYYEENPVYFAREISRGQTLGVSIFGGCCGTTPAFIEAVRERLGGRNTRDRKK